MFNNYYFNDIWRDDACNGYYIINTQGYKYDAISITEITINNNTTQKIVYVLNLK